MSEDVETAFRESRPESPPADFDFRIYSPCLQAELNPGTLQKKNFVQASGRRHGA